MIRLKVLDVSPGGLVAWQFRIQELSRQKIAIPFIGFLWVNSKPSVSIPTITIRKPYGIPLNLTWTSFLSWSFWSLLILLPIFLKDFVNVTIYDPLQVLHFFVEAFILGVTHESHEPLYWILRPVSFVFHGGSGSDIKDCHTYDLG